MCKSWKLTDRLETSNSIWKPKEINKKKNGILVTSLGVEKNNKMLKVISLYKFFLFISLKLI